MLVGVIMGSESDMPTMRGATATLDSLRVPYEVKIVSAHRTPDLLFKYAEQAKGRLDAIIAGAGGAAHLPGMVASKTTVPVLGVPIESKVLKGLDSLLSIVQMPAGISVATFGIGTTGAVNAAVFVAQMLASTNVQVDETLQHYRQAMTDKSLQSNASTMEVTAKEAMLAAYLHLDTYGIVGGDEKQIESQNRVFDLLRPLVKYPAGRL